MENYSACGKLVRNTGSAAQTSSLGAELAGRLKKGNIFLWGELGAGKTTFLKGLGKGLGIKENIVSPSFQLVRKYRDETGNLRLVHLDLYRLSSLEEIMHLGWDELLAEKAVTAIEWADRARRLWPERGVFIKFNHLSPKKRRLEINFSKKNVSGD